MGLPLGDQSVDQLWSPPGSAFLPNSTISTSSCHMGGEIRNVVRWTAEVVQATKSHSPHARCGLIAFGLVGLVWFMIGAPHFPSASRSDSALLSACRLDTSRQSPCSTPARIARDGRGGAWNRHTGSVHPRQVPQQPPDGLALKPLKSGPMSSTAGTVSAGSFGTSHQ